jgi:hypothetical protein
MSSLFQDADGQQTLDFNYGGPEAPVTTVVVAEASHMSPGRGNVRVQRRSPAGYTEMTFVVPSPAVAEKFADMFAELAVQMRTERDLYGCHHAYLSVGDTCTGCHKTVTI